MTCRLHRGRGCVPLAGAQASRTPRHPQGHVYAHGKQESLAKSKGQAAMKVPKRLMCSATRTQVFDSGQRLTSSKCLRITSDLILADLEARQEQEHKS